ncbi:MAG: hypothetical protein Q8O66_03420 [bacterium]|nr:hypothetical protein [bacterium]
MVKKIFDIKPPETAYQTQEQIVPQKQTVFQEKTGFQEQAESFLDENNPEEIIKKSTPKRVVKHTEKKTKKQARHRKKNKRSLLKKVLIGVGIFLAILVIYLFFKLPKAQVNIWPKMDVLNFKETIVADKSVESVDLTNKIIPAQYLQDEMDSSQEFSATGNASNEGKAGGNITIYNKCDFLKPVILKVGTHFISDSK